MNTKMLRILMVITLVFTMIPGTAFASEFENQSSVNNDTIQMNEYETVKLLAEKTEKELSNEGYTAAEIEEIKEYKIRYQNHIEQLNLKSDDVLKKFGYNEEQIDIIRNYTGSEAETKAIAATLTLSVTQKAFTWPGGTSYTTGRFSYRWTWNGLPMTKSTDIVAIGWNGWKSTTDNCVIYYYDMTTGEFADTANAVKVAPKNDQGGIGGAGYKIDTRPTGTNMFASKGSGNYYVKSDVHAMKDFYYYLGYGHTQLTVQPSFTVSASGATASVTFSSGVNEIDMKNNNGEPVIPNVN